MLANVPGLGRDFAGLARYLVEGQPGTTGPHRVQWTKTRNLVSDEPMQAAKIMTATAELSVRTRKPVYHLILSWSGTECPTTAAMELVVETTLTNLGLQNHQALIVAHGDTSNPHVHIMANRIDPETGTAWSTKHDYRRLECSVYAQAAALGFTAVPGRHNQRGAKQELPRVRSRGAMMKVRKERGSAKPWNREQTRALAPQLRDILEQAGTWQNLADRLGAVGVELVAKGQGLVIQDHAGTGYVKLSSLGKNLRLGGLEQRFVESFATFRARQGPMSPQPPTPQEATTPKLTSKAPPVTPEVEPEPHT